MANPAWPAELPQVPLLDGYSDVPTDRRLSFRPDVGPAIARQRANYRYGSIACSFAMSGFQVLVFENFWDNTTAGGCLPFDWQHPRRKNPITAMFDLEAPPPAFNRAPAPDLYIVPIRFKVIAEVAGASIVMPLWA